MSAAGGITSMSAESSSRIGSVDVEALLRRVINLGAFFAPPPGVVRIESNDLERAVFLDRPDLASDAPLIDVRHDAANGRFVITRNVRMRSVAGVNWLTEFVATVPVDLTAILLPGCVGMALTGTSRLPITSVETPLPAFVLGMLAYVPGRMGEGPIRQPLELIPFINDVACPIEERARLLEVLLRSVAAGEVHAAAVADVAPLVKTMFQHLALSPYTQLVDRLIGLLLAIDNREIAIDVMSFLLRHLVRHLSAFDLVRFHNRGANYPDALMLDAVLRAYIGLLSKTSPNPPLQRLRGRALRQAYLMRKQCEGLPVPDAPTSPGENAREMPHPHQAVPHEQLTEPAARSLRLFRDRPTDEIFTPPARQLLQRAIGELDDPDEMRELGTAVFLDRPLGLAKRDGEEDRTPLLSYEAFSARLARTRIQTLRPGLTLAAPSTAGFAVSRLAGHARQGVVSLEDAKKVALDFIFMRTTRSSLNLLLAGYDWRALNAADPAVHEWLTRGRVLLIRTGREMRAFDEAMVEKFALRVARDDEPVRYFECGGVEYVEGLHIVINGVELPIPPRFHP
jgi:hypothetical protein